MTEEDQQDRSIWDEFAEALEKQGKRTGISIEYDRAGTITFRSGNKVGFIGYTNEAGETCSIVVEPKIPDSAVGMLCATLGFQANKAFEFQDRQTNSSERPCSWLAAFFIRELEYFLTNIRPRGEEREEELHGRIKGRMLMSQYVKRNYIQRRIHVPCRFLDWTMDNLPNQILKSTLKRCLSILRNQHASDFSSSIGQGMSAMKSLGGISEIRIGLQHFTQVKPMISGSFRPYAQILDLAWMVASNLDTFDLYGENMQSSPLLSVQKPSENKGLQWDLIDMPELFERYLQHVTHGQKRALGLKVEHSSEKWLFKNRTIEPDCVVERTTATVVLDAKYKRMFEEAQVSSQSSREGSVLRMVEWSKFTEGQDSVNSPGSSSNTRKPNLGDQYQVVAYATHRDIRTAHAGLVYPSNGQGEDASPTMQNLGYSTTSMHGVTVYFLALRIDPKGIRDEFQHEHFLNNLQACLDDTAAGEEDE